MRNKKGFFFILDALLALTVVSVGVFLLVSSYSFTPTRPQTEVILEDVYTYLSDTEIQELNDPYAGIGGELWNTRVITEQENTLMEQIGELHAKGDDAITEAFIDAAVSDLIPPQFRLQVAVDGDSVYPDTEDQALIGSRERTPLLLAKSTVVYGLLNLTTQELWGPSTVTVSVWQG